MTDTCNLLRVDGVLSSVDALVRTLRRPSWDEYFMATAILISSRSSCERLHVGCVVVSSGKHPNRIIAAGYNGFLPGLPHESHVRDGHEQATVHAEQNAIADAAKRGISLEGATIYITHYPCLNCAKILAAAGIRVIKYLHDYKNDPLVALLYGPADVHIEQIPLRADGPGTEATQT
ncbi:MAG: dCMP deaminase family protein [Puniceicoccales bacterium]|jgi:dCMP deaminase|nr:dCMP deaminase family protein [Puniceicoccales bacterium]